ncbi:hypothetical protein ACIQT7_11830 [Agrobacterium deltaense]
MRASHGKCAATAFIISVNGGTVMRLGGQQAAALRGGLAAGVLTAMICLSASAHAQQYQNFEVTPDGRGGAQGTIGGRNFEVYRNYDRPPASRASPETRRELRRAVPQQTCIVDTEGRTRCR